MLLNTAPSLVVALRDGFDEDSQLNLAGKNVVVVVSGVAP